MDKRKLAQERNWSKKLITGFYSNLNSMRGLTLKEKSSLDIIKFHLDKLKLQWDVQSTELGLKPKNPVCANFTCQADSILLGEKNHNVSLYQDKELDIKVFLCDKCVDLNKYSLVSDEYKKDKLLGRT
jgi:hypothetical protein